MTEEVRPVSDNVAQARFAECVQLCKQIISAERAWANLGRLLTAMDADKDYETIGYTSMGRMLMEIELLTGYSRASCYHYKALYEQVAKYAEANASDMRLGSAEAFVTLPEHLQRDERIQMAASQAPEVFEEHIRNEHPEALWEKPKIFKIAASRWSSIQSDLDYYIDSKGEQMPYPEAMEYALRDLRAMLEQLEAMAVQK